MAETEKKAKRKCKTLAVYEDTYFKVLKKKNDFEIQERRVLSMGDTLDRLVGESVELDKLRKAAEKADEKSN